ncbi:histidine kinase-like protein [Krasilnikovia cinnamomea]|uniref:Histidine kinase-like protein n=1 Tax=Krasilnikovia cinnamomea TaxID=349313 RepID=A0A4Q7ZGT2_9ACTN|nr:ATP-binding protein [Krasilnikovia cinnamomea]RZU49968.1 histidine kinase-like protein [Krasilnikovia cinnamomea]
MRRDESPFLLFPGAGSIGQAVTAVSDFYTAITEVAVHGRWDVDLSASAVEVLRKCFADQPSGLIVDLHDLSDPQGASAPLWSTARSWGERRRPPVPVVVCLPSAAPLAAVLRRRGARWFLPIYATVPEARAALIASAAHPERLTIHLAPDPDALAEVPAVIDYACASWNLPELVQPATAVLAELVANAIDHARSRIDVAVSRRRAGLHLTVHDRSPDIPPAPRYVAGDPGDPARQGLGLGLVHSLADAWGALPTRTGKLVWATVSTPPATGKTATAEPSIE